MPTRTWTVRGGDLTTVASEVPDVLREWHVRCPFVDYWLRTTSQKVAEDDKTEVVVEYDDNAKLLSFDVWVDGKRVFGADDWLG
jgi:hypothetical protein